MLPSHVDLLLAPIDAPDFYAEQGPGSWNIQVDGVDCIVDPDIPTSDGSSRTPPPKYGEHSDQVLAELGYSPEKVAELRAARVI